MILCPGFKRNGKNAGENPPNTGSFLDIIQLQKKKRKKYNEKKLCRTMGIGMSIIAILLLTMGLFENILPAFFVYIASGIILVDVVVIIILSNTLCRK